MERKTLKTKARQSVKKHYFRNVILVFLASIIMAGGYHYSTSNPYQETKTEISENADALLDLYKNKKTNTEIIDEFLHKTSLEKEKDKELAEKYNQGVLSVFVNKISESESLVFGILNAFNYLLFDGNISAFITIIVTIMLLLTLKLLVQNTIVVGKNRYFLEQRKWRDTKIDKLLFPYKVKKTFNLAKVLFFKALYEFLWFFTIIGGVIKHYEYLMIPYLLAENPNIKKKEAFKLSKEMMMGHKLDVFKLDVSLIGWTILGLLTFNLTNIFYFDVYKECIYAELYMKLRSNVKNSYPSLLNDSLLAVSNEKEAEYPNDGYKVAFRSHRKWLNHNFRRDYSIPNYILFFFTFAILGWIYEVLLHLVSYGEFVNRGALFGPWLPIYGFGGVLVLIILKPFREKPLWIFIGALVLCGIVEYGTAWYLETFKHMRWWSYNGYFMNLNGRICLEGLLVFSLAGCSVTYLFAPFLDDVFNLIKPKVKLIICSVLLVFYGIDFIYSSINPHTGKGITNNLEITTTILDFNHLVI